MSIRTAQLHISRVHLHNYRGITEFTVGLEPKLTLLVGRNNVGKSRLLRAIAVATGGEAPSSDDLSHDLDPATDACFIDIELSPHDSQGNRTAMFNDADARALGRVQNQGTEDAPVLRFAWRTTLVPSKEGYGPRAQRTLLVKDEGSEQWRVPPRQEDLPRSAQALIQSVLIQPSRDLDKELKTRGTPANRLLKDLDIPNDVKETLEEKAASLSSEIVEASLRLADMRTTLSKIAAQSDTVGSPSIAAFPKSIDDLGSGLEISLETIENSLPLRFQGSGSRSLASLMIHGAMYRQLLGADGTDLRPHPVSLVEEPEAHLHPAAQADLAHQLTSLPGQVIATTHSSHVVTQAPHSSVRLLRRTGGALDVSDLHFEPEHSNIPDELRWRREELEKVLRFVERPFGELLFADAVVIPDGATERALLPPILRHVLGPRAAGIVVVDPQSMSNAEHLVKFLRRTSTPCFLYADGDQEGLDHAKKLKSAVPAAYQLECAAYADDHATESFFQEQFPAIFDAICRELDISVELKPSQKLKKLSKKKGTIGSLFAHHLIQHMDAAYATDGHCTEPQVWPTPIKELLQWAIAVTTPPQMTDATAASGA